VIDYAAVALPLSQVALSSCWLAFGQGPFAWRLIATVGLVFLWASLLSPFGIVDAGLPWLAFLVSLAGLVYLVAWVGRLLGVELRRADKPTSAVSIDRDGPRARGCQFSLKDVLLIATGFAVFLAPGRMGPSLENTLGKPTWGHVGLLAVTVMLGWGVASSLWCWRQSRGIGRGVLLLALLGPWIAILCWSHDAHQGAWLAVHAALFIVVAAISVLGKWTRPRSPARGANLMRQAGDSAKPTDDGPSDFLATVVLVMLASAWLLGPLRAEPGVYFTFRESLLMTVPVSLALAVSALWTFTIAWSALTVQQRWRRWRPSLVAFIVGVLGLVLLYGLVFGLIFFVPILLIQTGWSWVTLAVLRWGGYRVYLPNGAGGST
jgi:hypothetical protein